MPDPSDRSPAIPSMLELFFRVLYFSKPSGPFLLA